MRDLVTDYRLLQKDQNVRQENESRHALELQKYRKMVQNGTTQSAI